jgi:hypothetical protein
MTQKKIIIFLYNRLFDPLIQGNFWLYIEDFLNSPDSQVCFYLITYEDDQYSLSREQEEKIKRWKEKGLVWIKLRWHQGTGIKNKLYDIISGFNAVYRLRIKGIRHIVTLGSVAGTFVYLYGRLLALKLFLYQYEPHSEYAIDNRMWDSKSIVYKASNYLEKKSAEYAVVIASGTRFMEERLKKWNVKGKFVKIPTVVNDKKFLFSKEIREKTRSELNIGYNRRVIFYPGKFGSLYYKDEIAFMYRWLLDCDSELHFLIVTPHKDEEIHNYFKKAGVPLASYTIAHSDYPDIHKYYFASDFAVIAVPPGPSKKFISNIKVGEYLCAGMPYLITKGVSEDYIVAEEENVGVVVNEFTEKDIKDAWPSIKRFLEVDAEDRRRHCRDFGIAYRGFNALNPRFKKAINHLVNS